MTRPPGPPRTFGLADAAKRHLQPVCPCVLSNHPPPLSRSRARPCPLRRVRFCLWRCAIGPPGLGPSPLASGACRSVRVARARGVRPSLGALSLRAVLPGLSCGPLSDQGRCPSPVFSVARPSTCPRASGRPVDVSADNTPTGGTRGRPNTDKVNERTAGAAVCNTADQFEPRR